jgi:hypothetical protein
MELMKALKIMNGESLVKLKLLSLQGCSCDKFKFVVARFIFSVLGKGKLWLRRGA